jgi:hypothetical protein
VRELEVFDDRAEQIGRKKRYRADEEDDADK